MSDETTPMLHIPDDWGTFATIHNTLLQHVGEDLGPLAAHLRDALRDVSVAHQAANPEPGPEPESTAAGDRLEAAHYATLYAIQELFAEYVKAVATS